MIRQREHMNNHVTDVLECYQRSPITDCAPYLKEACERSEFIDIKLIRVFDVDFIKEFAERNPDVHIVHLVRDPKSLIAAQARFGTRLSPKALCGQLVRIGRLIRELKERGFSNAHEVFYEELAIDPVKYGKIIYDEMGLEMVEDVKRFLSREEYKEGQAIPKNASQVVVDNPVYHRYKFLEVFQLETILKIDKECKDVYDFWPSHYTDLSTMIRKYRADVVKYSSAHNRVMIQNYFPT
ncbi:hypothetical protein EB796_006971 [Bugula neritina]|uniref:Uncharacterized protein n=1 Tax=Bugula neritina TaxID=10212 RepID=A0A7J7K9V3_BUGNE|nr:hypothetical protein EB796_006971 [Bugula neritina]